MLAKKGTQPNLLCLTSLTQLCTIHLILYYTTLKLLKLLKNNLIAAQKMYKAKDKGRSQLTEVIVL